MIIRHNTSKEDIKQEISNLKNAIQNQKEYIHALEMKHKRKIRREQKYLNEFAKRIAKMQILIKTK